jgi:hypothetical protein
MTKTTHFAPLPDWADSAESQDIGALTADRQPLASRVGRLLSTGSGLTARVVRYDLHVPLDRAPEPGAPSVHAWIGGDEMMEFKSAEQLRAVAQLLRDAAEALERATAEPVGNVS